MGGKGVSSGDGQKSQMGKGWFLPFLFIFLALAYLSFTVSVPLLKPLSWAVLLSFTVYPAFLDVTIKRSADQTAVFEGRAETTTRVNDLPSTMPNLVTALFKDFPGASSRSAVVRVPQNR